MLIVISDNAFMNYPGGKGGGIPEVNQSNATP